MSELAWGSRERRYIRSQNKPWLVRIRGYRIKDENMSDSATLVTSISGSRASAVTRLRKEWETANNRIAELEAERDELKDILTWLDRRGGLGIDVHERIRAALSDPSGEKP